MKTFSKLKINRGKIPARNILRKSSPYLIGGTLIVIGIIIIVFHFATDTAQAPTKNLDPLQIPSAVPDGYRDYSFRFDESLISDAGYEIIQRLLPEKNAQFGVRYALPKEYFEIKLEQGLDLASEDREAVNSRRIVSIQATRVSESGPKKTEADVDQLFETGAIESDPGDKYAILPDQRYKVEIAHSGNIISITALYKDKLKRLLLEVMKKVE